MAEIDSALEYLHDLAEGAKYSVVKFEDAFKNILPCAIRKGFSDTVLKKLVTYWLKMKIPVTKLAALGNCLIPEGKVSNDIVLVVMHWIMSNHYLDKKSFKALSALNWLFGLHELNLMHKETLDPYYEFFYFYLNNDKLLVPASKFVYSYTKLQDVTRGRVRDLFELHEKKKSPKRSKCLMVLLGLFKSYRPDLVPEDIPQISTKVAFYTPTTLLMERLEGAQIRSNVQLNLTSENRLTWWTGESTSNQSARKNFRVRNVVHLLPDVDYLQLGSTIYFYMRDSKTKKCLDFTSTHDMLVYHCGNRIAIPSNILSLLVNDAGLYLLIFSDGETQARLSNVLYHTLYNNFLKTPKIEVNLVEKTAFLKRICALEALLQQGIPVVSRFLAQYICSWNGFDHSEEILELLQWITFETFDELYDHILEPIRDLFLTSEVFERCTLLNMLKKMCTNIHKMMKPERKFMFLHRPSNDNDVNILSQFSDFINELCEKSLNTLPGEIALNHCFLDIYEVIADLELECEKPIWSIIPKSLIYGILSSYNPFSIDRMLGVILKYREICEKKNETHGLHLFTTQRNLLFAYTRDYIGSLWFGHTFTTRHNGLVLNTLPEEWVERMGSRVSQYDQLLDIKNHIAFASFRIEGMDDVDKEFWFKTVISPNFKNISKFIEIFKS